MRLRLFLALVVTTGFASFPTGAADSALARREGARRHGGGGALGPSPERAGAGAVRLVEDAPRRDVRIVYPPLVEPR